MSLDSVPDVHLLLTRAQITISAWVADVCDNEEDQTICEEIRVISRDIMDRMSRILGNEDGHDDGRHEDDNEDESVESSDEEASDTPATKARCLTDKRLQIICRSCDMNPVLPEEFIDMINDGDSGSQQRCEDHAFGRLYRGYETCSWTDALTSYSGNLDTYVGLVGISGEFERQCLNDRLVSKDEVNHI
ncbi:hypothetical protein PILCRDRAFT_599 [Piloderma croceum F 1598]|uniref:Uncharacterized protein n=1 Tax=Piloderma croceum (strain F 1598) TaxID=765440 RepID=A0A0C3CNT9_PILCF|nr:hypothetical protein PILCRDRAFT_599 [Piloderma croceum F 1598]